MSISLYPDRELKIQNELSLEKVAGTGITADVGHVQLAQITYTGADVSTNIAAVSDIADPTAGADDWTDLVSITGGPMLVSILANTGTPYAHAAICIDENEDAGEDIRLQVVIDGTVVADITVTRDVGGAISNYVNFPICGAYYIAAAPNRYALIECNTSFVIRAAQEGNNFADAGTYVHVGAINYALID
jgi:hypothetical protein